MGEFTLIKRNGDTIPLFSREPFCCVKSAQQSVSLMGDDTVSLEIVTTQLITFEKGDKILVDGDEYSIRTTVTREKISDTHFIYKPVFYGVIYELMKTLYRNSDVSGRSDKSDFSLTYTIKDFVRVIIYNLNRDYPGLWDFDAANCPDTEAQTIQFNRQNCLKVLQDLCSKEHFNLDFRITQNNGVRTIHIGQFGTQVVPPGGGTYFEWGKGKGLYNLKEEKVDDKTIKTRLWVEGGIKNIRSDYRDYAGCLQLPYPKRLNAHDHTLRDGTVVRAGTQMIGIDDDTKRYLEDATLAASLGTDEDAISYDNIYPKRTGSVTALAYKTEGGTTVVDINSFIDEAMDFDLNETDGNGNTKYLIGGVSAKITFISGRLAGQEFELSSKSGYTHSERKFTILPFQDERGFVTPSPDSQAFQIAVGDQYKITDINLPKAYEDDAEEDLWYEAIQDFNDAKQAKVKYSLTLDRMYFLDNTPSDATVCIFKVGDYAPVKDSRFGIEKSIRITQVLRNLLVSQDYAITLSDTNTISIATQAIIDVSNHETILTASGLKDLTKARRGWRTTEELRTMIYDTDGFFDMENIRPLSIDTNMLTVGSKSQQFILNGAVLEANRGGNPQKFQASGCILSHLTIDDSRVRNWTIAAADFTLSDYGGYYLFAKCSKSGESGVWYITQDQLKVEPVSDPNNYYFQVGVLGSVHNDDNFRDFVTTYGFTRINGNTITTGKIVTSDGNCYIDLDGNAFRIGDTNSSIDWNVTANRQLTLRNVRLLSDSGDTSNIGVYRGTYNPNYVYYRGDEVSYTADGETCTYRYKHPEPSRGNAPTNSTYWDIVAKGATGETGNSIFYTFNDSLERPNAPTGSGDTGGWHTTSTDAVVWMSIKSAKTISQGSWGTPFKVKGADGTSIVPKGSKSSVSELPTTGNTPGDCYFINGYLYVWDGVSWVNNGQIKGDPGVSSYLHLKYSNDGGEHFTPGNGETPGRWIGMYVDQSVTDSDDPADYSWRDAQGEQGIPGEDGEDGRTTYLHIKYSNNGGLSFTEHNGEDPGSYIGQYTDFEEMDSSDPTRYTWSRLTGTTGAAGADSAVADFYEYRYAKNGSTTQPPALDLDDPDPSGWTTEMPTVGNLEYIWCTMCRKSGLVDRTKIHIPVSIAQGLRDTSGHGYNGSLGGGTVVTDGDREVLQLTGQADSRIPYDLPFGESFTLCLFLKTSTSPVSWMITGKYGREWVEKTLNLTADTWYHLAFRFNDTTCTLFINGEQADISVVSEKLVGFSLYDDNMFGSTVRIDEVRIMRGALAQSDIASIITNSVDGMIQGWCTPFRINPYDADPKSVDSVDVEYAKNTSRVTAPTTGWQTTAPTWENGKYIWSRTKVTYSDNTSSVTDPVCITGTQGNNGTNGVGISSIVELYYLSSSPTLLVNGSWGTSRPTWKNGWYMWTRSVITYTNGGTTTTTAICVTGAKGTDGDDGTDGKGVPFIHLKGTGLDNNQAAVLRVYDGYNIRTANYSSRGLTLITLNPDTLETVFEQTYDTYASDDARTQLANKLLELDSSVFVCLISYDAVGWNTNLLTALQSFGSLGVSNTATGRIPFAFLGQRGLRAGYALQIQGSTGAGVPPAELSTFVADGLFASTKEGTSPALVFRGNYRSDVSVVYYGTPHRVDCVKYNGVYYVARIDAGAFNSVPTDTAFWNTFGAQFESIATSLLLAEMANIGGFIFKDNILISQKGELNGVESEDYEDGAFIPNITLDAVNGAIKAGLNMTINENGLSLTKADGSIAAQVVNTSIKGLIDTTKSSDTISGTVSSSHNMYVPYGGARYTTTFQRNFGEDMGYMAKGSTIEIGNTSFSLYLPYPSSGTWSWQNPVRFFVILLRNDVEVAKWTGTWSGSMSSGTHVSGTVNAPGTINIDGTIYKEGRYKILFKVELSVIRPSDGSASSTSDSFNISWTRWFSYRKPSFEKTLIGLDGLFSCWGNDCYIISSSDGFIARKGNYGIRISSSGVQKTTDGGQNWSSI